MKNIGISNAGISNAGTVNAGTVNAETGNAGMSITAARGGKPPRADFGTLYRFELRKILKRKIVWITLGLLLAFLLITISASLLGGYYVDGVKVDTHYHMFQVDRGYQEKLDGRPIDQALLEEMKAGYGKLPPGVDRYTTTDEYQTYARPYSAIFHFARRIMGSMTVAEMAEMMQMQWSADEEEIHGKYRMMLEEVYDGAFLTQGEKEFWRGQEERLEWPVRFWYKEGYWQLYDSFYETGLLTLLAIAICLSGLFTEEHTRKTDQLILSSRYGKQTVYWAKFLAGVSFSAMAGLLFAAAAFAASLALYGSGGFGAAFQLVMPEYVYPLSVGQAVLAAYAMMLPAGILTGIFTMTLSELLHSNIGTFAVIMGIVVLTLFFSIPDQYRVLAQAWSYIPSEFITVESVFSLHTVPVFGKLLTAWQAVPMLYAFLGGILAFVGKRAYTKYQIQGR